MSSYADVIDNDRSGKYTELFSILLDPIQMVIEVLTSAWHFVESQFRLPHFGILLLGALGCTSAVPDSNQNPIETTSGAKTAATDSESSAQQTSSVLVPVEEELTRGISHIEKKEFDEAIDRFSRVLSHDPNWEFDESADLGARLLTQEVISQRKIREEEFASLQKEAYYYRGVAFLEKGFPNTAVEDFDEVLAVDKQDARAYEQRGRAYAELSELYDAVKDCTQAIRLNPTSGTAYYYRGWAYMNWQKPELAIADLREAVRLAPAFAEEAKQHIGQAYQCWYDRLSDNGDKPKAEAIYLEARRVIAAMASTPDTSNQDEDSADRYMVAKPITVELFNTHYQEGVRLFENGELTEAITAFNRSIQVDPDREEAYLKNGIAYLKRGFPNTALAFFNEALVKGMKSSELYCLMAQAYDEMGEGRLVSRYATKAIMLDPQNATAYRTRGLAYLDASEISLAKRDLDEAIRLEPAMKDELLPLLERSMASDRN